MSLATLQIGMNGVASRGGVDRYYDELLRALPQHDVRVRAVFAPAGTPMLARWSALRGAVARALPDSDLIVSHFAPYAFPVLDRIRTRPLAIHFHGPWALESAAEGAGKFNVACKRVLERAVYRFGGRVIVLSRAFGEIVERAYRIRADAIRVIPGGVDLRRFEAVGTRAQARDALGLPHDRPTVVTVRRLVRAKGLENLIDAIARVRREIPDVLVVVAGTGPLAADLQTRVRERDLDDAVRFAGHVPDELLPALYRSADLAVVPTLTLEGFGLVVVEALACGTPVLVTPVAGLPEVVRDLEPALVLAGSDANAIADGITRALRGQLPLPTPQACADYAQRFDWSAIAGRVRDVYREIA